MWCPVSSKEVPDFRLSFLESCLTNESRLDKCVHAKDPRNSS